MTLFPPVRSPITRSELPESRFPRQVWVGNWLDKLQVANRETRRVVRKTRELSWRERRAGYHGETKRGEMYQISVSFALENESVYSEPLPSVEGNRLYQIRMALAQYQAWPPIMGWNLQWNLPTGWVFTDALGSTTYDEFVSNPMVITRIIRSPVNPQPAAFKIKVLAKYP